MLCPSSPASTSPRTGKGATPASALRCRPSSTARPRPVTIVSALPGSSASSVGGPDYGKRDDDPREASTAQRQLCHHDAACSNLGRCILRIHPARPERLAPGQAPQQVEEDARLVMATMTRVRHAETLAEGEAEHFTWRLTAFD